MKLYTYEIQTYKTQEFINIDNYILDAIEKSKVNEGRALIFCTHTTAGITINENVSEIIPDKLKTHFRYNIGTGYNNLGLVLNLLGDVVQAYEMFEIALKLKPDDVNITRNIDSINENSDYIQQKPLWNVFQSSASHRLHY